MMQLADVCRMLSKLEHDNDVNRLEADGVKVWPLVRQAIWVDLVRGETRDHSSSRTTFQKANLALRGMKRDLESRLLTRSRPDSEMLFVSRPTNLQVLDGPGLAFDRVADPIMCLAKGRVRSEKLYAGSLDAQAELYFPGGSLSAPRALLPDRLGGVATDITALFTQAGLDAQAGVRSVARSVASFKRWYAFGRSLFRSSPNLKLVLISAWYFPDMMGLIAAAKVGGVRTVDVQHGKQGRYQGMYSGWTAIPPGGYQMLPDYFWCWGSASCEHILEASSDRTTHRPFVGGYPWPAFFRDFVADNRRPQVPHTESQRRVLFTLQGRAGAHTQPLPGFIVDFLKSPGSEKIDWRFRCHPNDASGAASARARLAEVPASRFEIKDDKCNLFDDLLWATHHVTAFSSCCYEADTFGVPTLLFGEDGKEIYADDIAQGRFTWTDGSQGALPQWLDFGTRRVSAAVPPYFVSSLQIANDALRLMLNGTADSIRRATGERGEIRTTV